MIKSVDHARAVASRRQAKGLRGLPRAVVRCMQRHNAMREWESSRAIKANVLNLPYNPL